jgi:hypothetical protein
MESLYQIVGLDVRTGFRNSYETDSGGRIVFDDLGRALSKSVEMTEYVLYVASFDACYAIHLSESHGGSLRGRRLCTFGHMRVDVVGIDAVDSVMYKPRRSCSFYADLWSDDYDYDIDNEVFRYSHCGGDESVSRGFVWVNLALFL